MSQNNFIEQHIKRYGKPLDHDIKQAKKAARMPVKMATMARKLHGKRAILFAKKRRAEKIQLQKNKNMKSKTEIVKPDTEALPAFLLDRQEQARAIGDKVKQQRQEKASKYSVPIPKIKGIAEVETFSVYKSGKRGVKKWKRLVTKPCFVGDEFTRKPPKYERFIRPMALRYKKAHVSHSELKATFRVPILGVKQNPHSNAFTSLGVLTKGTIIEVDVSELGMVSGSKIVWGKYAQITNNPENDGCVNAVLLL